MRSANGQAPARAALAGNPSDGYGGRTLAVTLPAFSAHVALEPADAADPADPLLAAALTVFARYTTPAREPPRVHMRFSTTIPERVGLAGSSAIVIAALRALASAHGAELPPERLAQLALEAETRELGIAAGPQDRVAQAYGGLVAMDFDPAHGPGGSVEHLDTALLPPLFVAWRREPAAPSGEFHSELRSRHERGDPEVRAGMERLAGLAAGAVAALRRGDRDGFGRCMDASFETRRGMAELDPADVRMVELARQLGAAANFAGSGGAIVATLPAGLEPAELARAFDREGCAVHAPAAVGDQGRSPPGMSG
jgi:glucuronokinase